MNNEVNNTYFKHGIHWFCLDVGVLENHLQGNSIGCEVWTRLHKNKKSLSFRVFLFFLFQLYNLNWWNCNAHVFKIYIAGKFLLLYSKYIEIHCNFCKCYQICKGISESPGNFSPEWPIKLQITNMQVAKESYIPSFRIKYLYIFANILITRTLWYFYELLHNY